MVQNAVKMYVAIFLSYPDRRRWVRKICQLISGQIKRVAQRCGMKSAKNEKATIVKEYVAQRYEEEDRIPELVCLWISFIVLAAITVSMFAVAFST